MSSSPSDPRTDQLLPIRTALVDAEPAAREEMRRLLLGHPSLDVTVAAGRPEEIDWSEVRLIFCDVDREAKRVLAHLGNRPPTVDVVLTSTAPKWAASAFEVDALDFLVKPIEKARLSRTIRRILRLDWAVAAKEVESGARVFVPFERGRRLIATSEICAIHAIGNYTQVRLAGGSTEIVMCPLRRWEESLAPGAFLRIHRSTLVNAARIRSLEMAGDGALASVDGLPDALSVSRRLLSGVRAALAAARPWWARRSSDCTGPPGGN